MQEQSRIQGCAFHGTSVAELSYWVYRNTPDVCRQNRPARLLLFWTPATVVSTLGLGFFALIVYAWLHGPRGQEIRY